MSQLSDLVLSLRGIALRTWTSQARGKRILGAALLLAAIACIFQPPAFAQQGASIIGILADLNEVAGATDAFGVYR